MKSEKWYPVRREETWTVNEPPPSVRQSFRYSRI